MLDGPARLKPQIIHTVGQHAGPTGAQGSIFPGAMKAERGLECETESGATSTGQEHTVKRSSEMGR